MDFGASSADQFGEFSIKVADAQRTSVRFEFKHKPRLWTSIKIGFLGSIRADLLIGTSSAGIFFLKIEFGSLVSSSSVKNVQTRPIVPSSSNILRVFLNGFGLNSGTQQIHVEIEGRGIGSSGVTVVAVAGPQTNLQKVYFSYMVFDHRSVPYASFGAMIVESSFSGTGHKDARNLIHLPNYSIQGLTKIKSSFAMGFKINVDQDFILTYVVSGMPVDFTYTYIFFGVRTNSICSKCTENYAYGENCLNTCP